MFSKRCALDARYVCECRKHKVLGLLWFELVNAVACIDATEGGAGGSMPREHEYTGLRFCRCLRRLRHRLYGFYFVKVDSVFFFALQQQRRQRLPSRCSQLLGGLECSRCRIRGTICCEMRNFSIDKSARSAGN